MKVSALFVAASLCLLTNTENVFSQSVGWNNAGNIVNNTSTGSLAWGTPINAQTSNNVYSSVSTRGVTNYLQASNFGFTMPSTGIVSGIEVGVERFSPTQPDVALLSGANNGWFYGTTRPAAISAGNNRCLVVVIGIENGPSLIPAPNDSRDVTSVTYGGQPLTQATEVAYSSIISGTSFWARNEIWYLNDAGITAATNQNIVITNPGPNNEYVQFIASFVLINVDQVAPAFDSRRDTIAGPVVNFNLGNPAPMMQGSCAVSSIVCGNPGSYTIGGGFVEGIDVNGYTGLSPQPSYVSSTPTMQTAHRLMPTSGSVAPNYTFTGYSTGVLPNRQVINMVCFQKARDYDVNVRLVKNGTIQSTNYASPFTWPISKSYATYGGPSDMWGTTWTPAQIMNSGFGFVISARIQNNSISVDHIRMRVHFTNPLPIELVDFSGQRIDKIISLEWSTASEINNAYFEIERSEDAVNYLPIERVPGAGNSNDLLNYSLNDVNAPQDKVAYYRLKQVDYDGQSETFGPIAINPKSSETGLYQLFPNPATTTIQIASAELADAYMIYNMNGQVVQSGTAAGNRINIDQLEAGTYLISIAGSDQRVKFIKQ